MDIYRSSNHEELEAARLGSPSIGETPVEDAPVETKDVTPEQVEFAPAQVVEAS